VSQIDTITNMLAHIKLSVINEDLKKPEDLGSETFPFLLLYNAQQGVKESFNLYV
jgi:hypothetical protein